MHRGHAIRLYAILVAGLLCIVAHGSVLSVDEALARCHYRVGAGASVVLTEHDAQGEPLAYAMDFSSGWALLSADDRAVPLLAYGRHGSVGDRQDVIRYWLDVYSHQIEMVRHYGNAAPLDTLHRPDIMPLCRSLWHQAAPYNDLCPMQGSDRCLVGCVALSMSQVMRYHNWPLQGRGSYSYLWNGITLSENFETYFPRWEKILDHYKEGTFGAEPGEAVARLVRSCGVSVATDYGTDQTGGSGSWPYLVPGALRRYWRYDGATTLAYRQMYTLRQWEDLLYDNLRCCGPVIYSGRNVMGGHTFVCDGLERDRYFHFLWGWDGQCDGYFLLSALYPGREGIGPEYGTYTTDQSMVVNILPDRGHSQPYGLESQGLLWVTTPGDDNTLILHGWYAALSDTGYNGQVGVLARNIVTQDTLTLNPQSYRVEYLSPKGEIHVTGLDKLDNGTWHLWPRYRDAYGRWAHIQAPATQAGYVTLQKSPDDLQAYVPLAYDTHVTAIDTAEALRIDKIFTMGVHVHSDTPATDMLTFTPSLYAYDASGDSLRYVGSWPDTAGEVQPGDNVYSFQGGVPADEVQPGLHYILFEAVVGQRHYLKSPLSATYTSQRIAVPISVPYPVTILPKSASLHDIEASTATPAHIYDLWGRKIAPGRAQGWTLQPQGAKCLKILAR